MLALCSIPASCMPKKGSQKHANAERVAIRCKAGDNHVKPLVTAAAAATPQPEGVCWNAYDDATAAHAETARHSMESADFWVCDMDDAEVPLPVHQDPERAAYMHTWISASLVLDAETSRNSLDSCDLFMD